MVRYPKLKYARLCRILTYVVLIGSFLLPVLIVFCVPFLPDIVRAIAVIGTSIALVAFIIKNYLVLVCMDMALALLSCHNTARTRFYLLDNQSVEKIEKSISCYGRKCAFEPIKPQPTDLRYQFCNPLTVRSRGIEKVVAAYHVDFLDADTYKAIYCSSITNSKALIGTKKALFLDKMQKKAPLHRVTVIVIFTHKVDAKLSDNLYRFICKQCGDDMEDSVVPCIINLENHSCVFNCLRMPYVGFGYPAKNRGIRMVKRLVFGGRLPLMNNNHLLDPIDLNPEDSLWELWSSLYYEVKGKAREMNKRFEAMEDREIMLVNDELYLKWGKQGIVQDVKLDTEKKTASMESIRLWSYPKTNPIAKKTIQNMEEIISDYFLKLNYALEFSD